MRNMLLAKFFVLVFSVISICQEQKYDSDQNKNIFPKGKAIKCSANPDYLYTRQITLQRIADMLNNSIPEYRKNRWSDGFYVQDEQPGRFSIYDLTDTSNFDSALTDNCINFINNHIYHVAPADISYSFSHIVILEDGNLKVFKSINCKDRGNSLNDVLTYLNEKLKDDQQKDLIISRVKNYREYGSYLRRDYESLQCQKAKDNE